MSRISRWCFRTGVLGMALSLLALAPAPAHAQTGRILGTVTDTQGKPISGAQVSVVGTRFGALTNPGGQFVVTGVPAGTHDVRVSYLGFAEQIQRGVSVASGGEARVDFRLEGAPVQIGGVVVSASRQAQRITDAPATVSRVDASVIDNAVGNTWASALKEVRGLDFIQTGMTSAAINARGFNSSFNNRMLMMEDGRIAVLPENGLPVGQFTAIPKVDLAGVEVLVGPGAALYGPDASSGVVTLQTKDPRQFPGTTVEATGGNRQYKNVQLRSAIATGDWGFKVAGEWQDANDWENELSYTITGLAGSQPTRVIGESQLGENSIDWQSNVIRGTGTVVRYFENGAQLDFSAGASQSNGVGQTNVGRNQLKDWRYNYAQLRFSNPSWFLNVYRAQSQSGESFAINRYADAFARNPSLSPDSLRRLSDWPSDGRLYAAEAQNNFRVAPLLDTRIVWGVQYRRDVVSSDRQWLTDRLTGDDIEIDQYGVYAQTETPVTPWLNLVLAGRYDDHDNYDAQFSPKAGLVFKPAENQALRLTYNRAYKSPTTLQTNFYIPDWTAVIAIYGNTEGFTIKNQAGTTVATYDPLGPEQNVTWEAGYKGILANRLFVDVAGYHSRYEDFLSPLVIIANPFLPGGTGTFAHDGRGELIRNPAGIAPVTLTYYNLGRAKIYGTDVGLNYYLSPRFDLRGTFSYLATDTIEVPQGREEATSLNSPHTKWTLGAGFENVAAFRGGATVRHVSSYYFRSGINMGRIPTFTTLDLNLGYQLPWLQGSAVQVGIGNLFACSQKLDDQGIGFRYDTTPGADPLRQRPTNKERECGFGVKHQEMINMPAVGTMVFVGMRFNVR